MIESNKTKDRFILGAGKEKEIYEKHTGAGFGRAGLSVSGWL